MEKNETNEAHQVQVYVDGPREFSIDVPGMDLSNFYLVCEFPDGVKIEERLTNQSLVDPKAEEEQRRVLFKRARMYRDARTQ